MKLLLLILLVAAPCMVFCDKVIPQEFFGKWDLDRSENFEEYLEAKGVGFFVRKMILWSSVSKVFGKDPENAGTYLMENLSRKKNTKYTGIVLGKEFQAEGMDSTQHKITFDVVNNSVTEKHIRMNDQFDEGETYYYSVENGQLVLKLVKDNITCKRWFKRDEKFNQKKN